MSKNVTLNYDVNVLFSRINRSDHNPVQLNLELENDFIETFKNDKTLRKKINWTNPNFRYEYRLELTKLIKTTVSDVLNFHHRTNPRTKHFLDNLTDSIYKNAKKAEIIAAFKLNDTHKHKKLKPWWDEELINHHIYVCSKKAEWAATEFKDVHKHKELIEARKDFNKLNKYKEKLKRNARIRNLDKLFRLNKQEFWSQMRKMKRDNTKLKIDIDKMKEKYEEQFNSSLINNNINYSYSFLK